MNTHAMVVRLNELDQQLCSAFGIPRTTDATTLDEAIAMSAATTRLLAREDAATHDIASPTGGLLTTFLQAQVEARQMRAGEPVDVVRTLTAGIRRMKKAGSLQGLGRQACTELCEALGFDSALLSFVEDDGFVVEESDHGLGGPTVIHAVNVRPNRTVSACVTPSARMRLTCPPRPATWSYSVRRIISLPQSSPNHGSSRLFTSVVSAMPASPTVTLMYWSVRLRLFIASRKDAEYRTGAPTADLDRPRGSAADRRGGPHRGNGDQP